MIPINIDISQLANQFSFDREQIKGLSTAILNRVTMSLKQEWINQSNVLKSSRNEYQKSIYIKKISDTEAIVGLTGWLPNAVENGLSPFDEKAGFERSPNKRTSLRTVNGVKITGWYLTIPFRWATPQSLGESEAFTGNMPKDIYDIVKNFKSGQALTYGMLPEQQKVLGIRPKVTTSSGQVYEDYTHKSPLAEGMTKSDKKSHGSYVTFRRVSDRSELNAWVHTGIEARDISQKAVDNLDVNSLVLNERDKFLSSLGF